MRAVLLTCLIALSLHAEEVADIIRAYSEHNSSRLGLAKNYTCQLRSERRTYDRTGKLKSKDVTTLDFIYQKRGLSVRVTGKNDKPLSPEKALKEQAIKRRAANARPPSGRQFLEGYRFQLETVEQLKGRPAWVISGQSRTGESRIRLWIDQADYECARFEGELTFEHAQVDDRITFELIRMDEGVWLPAHTLVLHYYRLPPFQRLDHQEFEITYMNYKKFQAESRVVDTSEAHHK